MEANEWRSNDKGRGNDKGVEIRTMGSRGHNREECGGCGLSVGQRQSMSINEYYYCKRYSHKEDRCWDKKKDE